jgi:SAM-dependent methyltransferase
MTSPLDLGSSGGAGAASATTDYVLAHAGQESERRRLKLLERFHGPLTIAQLEHVVRPGWNCLEVGAGAGAMSLWLAERVIPGGSVHSVDLETHWLQGLRSDVIDVRALDITTDALPTKAYDLVLARMLLLHLADPVAACRRLLGTARKGATLAIHDADFSALTLHSASPLETEGLRTMTDTMQASGVDLALGPTLPAMLTAAGADVVAVHSSPSPGHGNGLAARITAITIERFRTRSEAAGAHPVAIDAAISALRDPNRRFTGPTQWIVRAHAR